MIPDDVIAQCRAGNEAAFRVLYHRTVPRVHAWVARLLGPDAALADVIQEVYLHVHRSIAGFRGDAAFTTWLHRLTINVGCSHMRRRARHPQEVPTDGLESVSYDEEARLIARDSLRRLFMALEGLSPEKRVVFILYELEGLSLKEIADLLGTGVPTVAARLRRARSALVESFADAMARPGATAKEKR